MVVVLVKEVRLVVTVDDLYFGVRDVVFKTKVFNRHGTFDWIANRNMENLNYAYLHCDLLEKAALSPISLKVKSPQIYMSSICQKACLWGSKIRAMSQSSKGVLSQPYFERVWGWDSHSRNGDLEILQDSRNFRVQCKGQNTSHWGVLYIIGKLSKCRCRKWAHMSHLDICSISYGKKKGRESNWQFDSRPLKVGNRPDPDAWRGVQHAIGKLSTTATTLL